MKNAFLVSFASMMMSALLLIGCQTGGKVQTPAGGDPAVGDPLAAYDGKVLVLVMGMPGCGGTAKVTKQLDRFHKTRPQGVEVMRLDVAPPGGKLKPLPSWDCGYPHAVDMDRSVAERLSFFYYPTLYILDKDGDLRYTGEYPDDIDSIVKEIAAEKPGASKRMFSPTMLAEGEKPDLFSCASLKGGELSSETLCGKKATLIIFSSLNCPFSKKAIVSAPDLAAEFKSKGASVIVINKDSPANKIRSFYEEKMPDVPVLVDPEGKLCEDRFGVTAVPFCYVLNGEREVTYKMPFTSDAAQGAMKSTLGLTKGRYKIQSKGAG